MRLVAVMVGLEVLMKVRPEAVAAVFVRVSPVQAPDGNRILMVSMILLGVIVNLSGLTPQMVGFITCTE